MLRKPFHPATLYKYMLLCFLQVSPYFILCMFKPLREKLWEGARKEFLGTAGVPSWDQKRKLLLPSCWESVISGLLTLSSQFVSTLTSIRVQLPSSRPRAQETMCPSLKQMGLTADHRRLADALRLDVLSLSLYGKPRQSCSCGLEGREFAVFCLLFFLIKINPRL